MEDLVLMTRPDHDDTTFYLPRWCKDTVEIADSLGKLLADLKGRRANRKEFESILNSKTPTILLLHGHGTESSLCGHQNEVILDIKNSHLLKSKIVYAVSCKTAKTLGYHVVKEGIAKAFI